MCPKLTFYHQILYFIVFLICCINLMIYHIKIMYVNVLLRCVTFTISCMHSARLPYIRGK